MHNSSTSFSLSLFFSLFPRGSGGWLQSSRVTVQSAFSLSLQVNKSPSESRAMHAGTAPHSHLRHTGRLRYLYSAFSVLLPFSSSSLPSYSDSRGGFCTLAKVDGKQAHNKSLTFVRTLSFCCRDNVKGQKREKCQNKNVIVH